MTSTARSLAERGELDDVPWLTTNLPLLAPLAALLRISS